MPLKQKNMFFCKTLCPPGQYPRGYPWEVMVTVYSDLAGRSRSLEQDLGFIAILYNLNLNLTTSEPIVVIDLPT